MPASACIYKFLKHADPWNKNGREKYDDGAVNDVLKSHPDAARAKGKFKVGGFGTRDMYPLSIVVCLGASPKVVERICNACPESLKETDCTCRTPLHWSCRTKASYDVVKILVDRFPKALEWYDHRKRTPLHLAYWCNAPNGVVDLLTERFPGAHCMKDKYGNIPVKLKYRPPPMELPSATEKRSSSAHCCKSVGMSNNITILFFDPVAFMEENGDTHAFGPRLSFEKERDILNRCQSISQNDIKLSFEYATRDRLQELATAPWCQCLHFSGHGGNDQAHNTCLFFEDGKGGLEIVTEHGIRSLIGDREPFRFAFLSACHSERIGRVFVKAGVRHIVCIDDGSGLNNDAAFTFEGAFYHALFSGSTIEASFNNGKGAVNACFGSEEASRIFLLLPEDGDHKVSAFDTNHLEREDKDSTTEPPVPVTPHFIGREVIMHTILYSILSSDRLVTIYGGRGMGRSSLAAMVYRYIYDRLNTIPDIDAIFFVRARHKHALDVGQSLLTPLFEQLRESNSRDETALEEFICGALKNRKALLVLDGADGVEGEVCHFLHHLFEQAGKVRVLITAQKPTGLMSPSVVEKEYVLGPLDCKDAVKLFGKVCKHIDTSQKRNHFEAVFWSKTDNEREHNEIFRTICDGVPSRIVETARDVSEDEFHKIFPIPR